MARFIPGVKEAVKPAYIAEPLPGETDRLGKPLTSPASTHPFGVYERAAISSLQDKQDDLVADVLRRKQKEAIDKKPTYTKTGATGEAVPLVPRTTPAPSYLGNIVGTYKSEEQRQAAEKSRQEASAAVASQAETARQGRLAQLNEQVERLRNLGVAKYQPSSKVQIPVTEIKKDVVREQDLGTKKAEKTIAEYEALPEEEKQRRRDEAAAKFEERKGKTVGRIRDVTEGEDIGDGQYIDPITRQVRRRRLPGASKSTPKEITEAARVVAVGHYRQTPEGKTADKLKGQVKNPITNELHPGVESWSAYKNPISYMKKKMEVEDPETYIRTNHPHLLPQTVLPSELPKSERRVFQTPKTKGFQEKYLKTPLPALAEEEAASKRGKK